MSVIGASLGVGWVTSHVTWLDVQELMAAAKDNDPSCGVFRSDSSLVSIQRNARNERKRRNDQNAMTEAVSILALRPLRQSRLLRCVRIVREFAFYEF